MDVNPFQKSKPSVQTDGLDNYQPFQNNVTTIQPEDRSMYEDLEKKQKDLDARAAELDRREKEQAYLLSKSVGNNFPPLPSFCPFKPCFYQDINVDIPANYVNIVTSSYHLWIGLVGVTILNFFTCLGYFIGSQGSSMAGSTFGSSILMLVLCPPAAYICWFRPLYKAFKNDSSANFFIFFFVMAAQIVVTIIQAMGIYWLGSCGWLNSLQMLKMDKVAGSLMLLTATAFTILGLFEIILFIKVHRLYRNTDASFEKAKTELGSSAATSLISSGKYSGTS